ncbi:hypothetical protein L211DRAFT_593435 [Terfezia boudieri ATCC MYA-4762]|uniref:Uncharacterized protein n=1 Tax=Terfezia boudieri ATCC MYA-4762 TaxID=1051890 RepID=A0A3N4LNY8_9PEZI|nr:hypothetical protein L211DRAFT_593435 [Terfezia boudieri ATCC MYA-4762]
MRSTLAFCIYDRWARFLRDTSLLISVFAGFVFLQKTLLTWTEYCMYLCFGFEFINTLGMRLGTRWFPSLGLPFSLEATA